MSCKNCFPNCVPISDKCIKISVDSEDKLEICNGDTLAWALESIIEKLLSALDGTGITPKDITLENSAWIKEQLEGRDANLINLLQILIDSEQHLKELVEALGVTTPFVFNLGCLNLETDATRDQILQAVVTLLCSMNTIVSSISNTYVKLSDFTTKVQEVITSNQVGGISQNYNKMIPFVAYPYFGPLSNFDSTGKGVVAAGFEKVYICNGLSGTPDMRGRVPSGAVRNVPGGPFDAAVDPNNPINPNTNKALGDKFGENYHKLSSAEMPPHTHSLVDPGHSHEYTFGQDASSGSKWDGFSKWNSDTATKSTKVAKTGITMGSAGNGEAHNNIQPSIACNFIMYIP